MKKKKKKNFPIMQSVSMSEPMHDAISRKAEEKKISKCKVIRELLEDALHSELLSA